MSTENFRYIVLKLKSKDKNALLRFLDTLKNRYTITGETLPLRNEATGEKEYHLFATVILAPEEV